MKPGAVIYMSGFYLEDVGRLQQHAETLGLEAVDIRSLDNWACMKMRLKQG